MEEQDKYYPKSQEQPLKIYILLPNKSHKYDTSCWCTSNFKNIITCMCLKYIE